MHQLGRDQHYAGAEIEVHAQRLEDVEGLAGLARAEALHVVRQDLGRGEEAPLLGKVAAAAHADEARRLHLVRLPVKAEELEDVGHAVRVAADDLDEAVLTRDQRRVVDLVDVELAEAEVGPASGDEAHRAVHGLVARLAAVGRGRAVDHHLRPLQRLLGVVGRVVALPNELLPHVAVDAELRAAPDQALDLGPFIAQRRALGEGNLVDAELLPEVREQPDEGLPHVARADHVDVAVHL